jgi:hypothetical protein
VTLKDNPNHKSFHEWDEEIKREEILTQYRLTDTPEGIPRLTAYDDDEGHLKVYCDWCGVIHTHGIRYGHRWAHCLEDGGEIGAKLPYLETGYVLVPQSSEVLEFKREEVAKMLA